MTGRPWAGSGPDAQGQCAACHWPANLRRAYGPVTATGTSFKHESPRRGETFLTRKVTRAVGRIAMGLQDKLYLGNLDAKRDWGYAGDYVKAMWLMLQQDEPDDYVIATGESHSVREFVEAAFGEAGLDWRKYVETDPRYIRPTEVDHLEGDASRARSKLGWAPEVTFAELVRMMVAHDMELARQERTLRDAGHVVAARGAASF